ncbi:MAG TPA: hypothetical protein VE714_11460, partial [Gemmatimonadales bacterium]|nr:hypothetical protein [Gemmatimonadales bacterium]
GTVTRASDGLKDSFTNVPGTLSRASRAGPSSTSAISLAQTQFAGPCDILSFAIQPLDLDVLGLTLELSLIAIDVRGVPGPGNALGNLLCSVVTLLDNAGMTVSAINAQLDRVNTILATGS